MKIWFYNLLFKRLASLCVYRLGNNKLEYAYLIFSKKKKKKNMHTLLIDATSRSTRNNVGIKILLIVSVQIPTISKYL